jgi:hypothetical protein
VASKVNHRWSTYVDPGCGACAPANSHTRARAAARAVLMAINVAGASLAKALTVETPSDVCHFGFVLDRPACGCRVLRVLVVRSRYGF